MSGIANSSFVSTMGYRPEVYKEKLTDFSSTAKKTTIANIAAIIPGIGNIIGLVRIVAGLMMLHDARVNTMIVGAGGAATQGPKKWNLQARDRAIGYIARGAFEVVGGGTVLWVADIAFTIGRNRSSTIS